MSALANVLKKSQAVVRNIIGVALSIIMVVILAQTFTRYVIFHSLPWSEELSRYLFVFLVLVGANVGVTDNMMVSIDIIDNFMSAGMKKAFTYIRLIIGVVVNAFFFYSTFDMIAIGKFQVSPAMQIPMSYMYMVLAAGFFLEIIAVLAKIGQIYLEGKEGGKA